MVNLINEGLTAISTFVREEVDNIMSTVILGDSITQWNPLKYEGLVNMGLAGDTTRDIFWRIEEVKNIEAKKVIFMAGINDILMGFSFEKSCDFYQKITTLLKENFGEVILLSVLPIDGGDRINVKVRKLNEFIETFCEKNNLRFLNLSSFFCDENYNLKNGLSTDGIHLSSKGYEILNEEIMKLL